MRRALAIVMFVPFLCSGAPAIGIGTASGEESCAAAAGAFDQVVGAENLGEITQSYGVLETAGCSEQVLYCAGNSVALAYVEAGYRKADAGSSPGSIRDELVAGKAYGSPWQLLVGLADLTAAIAREGKDGPGLTEAATYYQDALNTINEPPICTDASGLPSDSEIASIHKRMTEALLLAPEFEVVRTRAGGCGGIFLESIRGFTPTFRPLPINFEFDKAEFTPGGRQAAEQLLKCLVEEKRDRVVLSGHTDMKGSESYNLALSARRLDTVKTYLREGGFSGELELIPLGESEPFEADDPSQYSEEEIDQLNRRVVLRETAEQ